MPRNFYSDEFKAETVKKASEIGAAKAAKEAGVSYQSLLKWIKTSSAPQNVETGNIAETIEKLNAEIEALNNSLKEKKAELKALQKQQAKEEKAAARKLAKQKAEEEEKELLSAIEKSGLSYQEIMERLK